ncbi:MAG TPA: 4Fe-4S dicluster domain-containing protein, partial [Phycisphaerae bacterium]|nr:4Fe-4S dicluster domain-containing protein [Phycisphaerae bacterium]
RRGVFGAAAAGLAGLVMLRATPQARGKVYNPELVRPPGARTERDFLSRCTGCGACMQICPTGGLQPTLTEAGLAGLWTPRLAPRIGYCDYECNRCGQVCPTEAIMPLPLKEKQQVRIGLASFDTTRCIPYALGRECAVCEEHCPVPRKAIYLVETEVLTPRGQRRVVKQPRINAGHCIGCGTCEHVCPFKDRPAIRVTSANESRHSDNQPILPGSHGGGSSPHP